ncbi:MAG: 2-oxo-4-hydroxy-4-carboxy-5-ureidoimidazoline decarboxylase [Candidatus Sulfotelmatobacter sp.]
MSEVLLRWNNAPLEAGATQILPCCGSMAWAREMAARRPFQDEAALMAASDQAWRSLTESDWMEAFNSHPRIGESNAANPSAQRSSVQPSSAWAIEEQKEVADAGDTVKIALVEGNREYERRFGRIFIVCATGKSGAELLEILRRRLQNEAGTELYEAAEQQRQITRIRLKKWLQG